MQRRTFLYHAAIMGSVVLVGLPDTNILDRLKDHIFEDAEPRFYLHGHKASGCALPRGFHRAGQLPYDIAAALS